nr:transmembrane protein 64-like isoform X2 [Procambarus clarkii]
MRLLPNWCLKNSSVTPTDTCGGGGGGGGGGGTGGGGGVFLGNSPRLEALTNFTTSKSTRTHLTNVLVTAVGVAVVGVGAFLSRDYVRRVLLWVAVQEAWVVVLVFLALFSLVSLPFMWGYIVVNVSAGYMFGTWRGLAVTVSTATAGVCLAHLLIRLCLREVVRRRVVTSRLLRALLAVLGGPQAFKVVLVTRLTPIPFGLQNAVFAVSHVPTWLYLLATVLGLLPTQVLNCYLGTTVRSLDDVVSQSASVSATGWGVFAVQIVISIGLTVWVVRRAKAELHKTMASQLSDTQPTLASPTHSCTPTTTSPTRSCTPTTTFPTRSCTPTTTTSPTRNYTPTNIPNGSSNGRPDFLMEMPRPHSTKLEGVNYGYDADDDKGPDDELILAAGAFPITSLATSTSTFSTTSSFTNHSTTTNTTTSSRRNSVDDIFILIDSPT